MSEESVKPPVDVVIEATESAEKIDSIESVEKTGSADGSIENTANEEETVEKKPSEPEDSVHSGNNEEKGDEENEEGEDGTPKEVLSDEAQSLKEELSNVVVEAPPPVEIDPSDIYDPAEFPESYNENLSKEKLVLKFAENFRRQFVYLYRDRKPLLLNPANECGIEKFVCTTIRPTQLPYKELYNWDGAAEFVADYLNFKPLEIAYELPNRLVSPTSVMERQRGNCFEYSTLLVSLLIAAGYDAYVVSGYASKETCMMDETRGICPMLQKKEQTAKQQAEKLLDKYTVKPPKDLRSKFELKMEARAQKKIADEEEKLVKEAEELQLELEKPPPDDLLGMRVHCWVLVLEGKREVPDSFFIEPLTGMAQPVKSSQYHGIEAVWNDKNYWVNMQDCSEGVVKMTYDLGDCTQWEFMFPSNDKPILQLPDEDQFDDLGEEEAEDLDVEKHLDIPPSWVNVIELSLRDFQMRCPMGKKIKLYKRAKLEKFAHYLMRDGLVARLSVFQDRDLIDLLMTKEYYQHRHDQLYERQHNQRTGWVTESFKQGRHKHLKEHMYKASAPGAETERTMHFFHQARVDGLDRRCETPTYMEEHFVDRDDHLYYRAIDFVTRPKKFGPADSTASNSRPIQKMIERYHRNEKLPANEDFAELVYNITDVKEERETISITYHTEDDKVSASTREYLKPPYTEEKGCTVYWQSDMHNTFQVDPDSDDLKKVQLYEMLVKLLQREDVCKEMVRRSEDEVQDILNERTREESASELDISVYDTRRNVKARKHREELDRIQEIENKRRQEAEVDFLAPFLAQIGDPEKIHRKQAYTLKEDCLADLKQRLIDKANLIQARFEKETHELQKKQAWYQQNQVSMQKDDEEAYLAYCSEAMFRINILELRLNRHKEMAPAKYMALEQKIRSDPRFVDYF